MKPFRFRLESFLRLRESARDERRVQLAHALAELQRLQTEHQAIERQAAEHRRHDRELRQSSAFSLELLHRSESLRQSLASEQSRILAALTAAALRVDACQQSLAAAECEYQAVAKLRTARLAEHERLAAREDQKLADEAAGRTIRRAA